MTTITREQEIAQIWKEYRSFFTITLMAVLVGVGMVVGFFLANFVNTGNDTLGSLFPEALGILFTVIVLDRLNERRATERLKKRLIREAGGQSKETAKAAIDWMRKEGWLEGSDGLLKGANLCRANLLGADLNNAYLESANLAVTDLREVRLWNANLENANLSNTNLENAFLIGARLRESNLTHASLKGATMRDADLKDSSLRSAQLEFADLADVDLQGATLWNAHLPNTNLEGVNLQGANLKGAHLKGANLEYAIFDGSTILPDAEPVDFDPETMKHSATKYWTLDTDMTRYTDPDHPDFWEPDWVKQERGESE